MSLRIIFAGTPEFAIPSLAALVDSNHHIIGVITQPDRPAGRGRQLKASPIKEFALSKNLDVLQADRISTHHAFIEKSAPDALVVVAYGALIPQRTLNIPRFGGINVHPSLLPRWRGPTPIQAAMLAGDQQTGVSIMQMNATMDGGDILKQVTYDISPQDTSGDLHQHLAQQGAGALIEVLNQLCHNSPSKTQQDESQVTLCHKINKSDAAINWQQPATLIHRQINAYNPWPVAYTYYQQQRIRIWQADLLTGSTQDKPGSLCQFSHRGLDIATGQGLLRITRLQLPGKKPMAAADFIHAHQDLQKGQLLFEDNQCAQNS